jgi:predicted lipoprotein with Yx(FWY)xxD motif
VNDLGSGYVLDDMGGTQGPSTNGVIHMRIRWWAAPGAVAAVALLAACGSSGSSSGGSSSPAAAPASSSAAAAAPTPLPSPVSDSAAGITTAKDASGTFLVTAQGAAIYLFAPDTPTHSACTAACLKFWPALQGTPSAAAGSGLTGTFGTIKGTGGITQATYDGHPLDLFVADKDTNDPTGNGVNAAGGLWWALTPGGTDLPKAAAAAQPSKKSSSSAATTSGGGAGGYGY